MAFSRSLLIIALLTLSSTTHLLESYGTTVPAEYDELQSPDFYEPKAVRIRNFANKSPDTVDKSWPPANAQEFSRIDITVMGKRVDGATLYNLLPDMRKMKEHRLRKLLEPDYDSQWMSVSKPTVFTPQQPVSNPFAVDAQLSLNVNSLNFTLMDELGSAFLPDPRLIYMFKSWLLRQASCPLEYLWEDLGVLFWPRWIKRGMCSSGKSCSWPSGMRCRSNGSRTLKVLRWVCTEEERRDYRQFRRSNDKGEASSTQTPPKRKKGHPKRKLSLRQRKLRQLNRLASEKEDDGMLNPQRLSRRRRKLTRKLSSQVGNYKCQWMNAEIPVVDKCACMCR